MWLIDDRSIYPDNGAGPETFAIPRWDTTSNDDVWPLMSVTILAADLIASVSTVGWSRLPLLLYYFAFPSIGEDRSFVSHYFKCNNSWGENIIIYRLKTMYIVTSYICLNQCKIYLWWKDFNKIYLTIY